MMTTNEQLAATWERRARMVRGGVSPSERALAKADQLEADAAELLRSTPNVGHDGCVPSSGYSPDQHTHEGQTGFWLFPSEAPETVKAADGKTDLHRFDIKGIVYARNLADARRRLVAADIYLDSAEIVGDHNG